MFLFRPQHSFQQPVFQNINGNTFDTTEYALFFPFFFSSVTKDHIIYFGRNSTDDRKASIFRLSVVFTIGFNGAR